MVGAEPENFENFKMFSKESDNFFSPRIDNLPNVFGYKVYGFGEFCVVVIWKILKVWPSCIAGKRSFVAFTIYQKPGPTLFLVAQVYLIFCHCISRIYLNCTFCVRWGGYTPHTPPPVPTSLNFIECAC